MKSDDPNDDDGAGAVLRRSAVAIAIGTALSVLVVLPAEYGIDPTGFGRLLGLDRLRTPAPVVVPARLVAPPEIATLSDTPFRTDTVTFEVPPYSENFGQLEYKLSMPQGAILLYSWTAERDLIYEFHGHTEATAEDPQVEVMTYLQDAGAAGNGTLTAPSSGLHGWYWAQADFAGEPLPTRVTISLAGYYTLEPGVVPVK